MDSIQTIFKDAIGAYGAIFLLLVFAGLILARKLITPQELDSEAQKRKDDNNYRDTIIERQSTQIDRLQSNFETALRTIREDVLPLIEKAMDELHRQSRERR